MRGKAAKASDRPSEWWRIWNGAVRPGVRTRKARTKVKAAVVKVRTRKPEKKLPGKKFSYKCPNCGEKKGACDSYCRRCRRELREWLIGQLEKRAWREDMINGTANWDEANKRYEGDHGRPNAFVQWIKEDGG